MLYRLYITLHFVHAWVTRCRSASETVTCDRCNFPRSNALGGCLHPPNLHTTNFFKRIRMMCMRTGSGTSIVRQVVQ